MMSKSMLHSTLWYLLVFLAGLLPPQEIMAQIRQGNLLDNPPMDWERTKPEYRITRQPASPDRSIATPDKTVTPVRHLRSDADNAGFEQLFLKTPVMDGPVGKLDPYPNPPSVYPDPYEPPPMEPIPAGGYEMGDHSGIGYFDERPVHAVYIDSFHMDTFEVTNEEYCTYLNSAWKHGLIDVWSGVVYKKNNMEPYCDTTTGSSYSRITWNGSTFGITTGKENHPMVMVSWFGAVAYANWRSAREGLTPCYNLSTWECTFDVGGFRLPTEAEWEKAARGGEHSPYYEYPWGNGLDGSKANFFHSGDPHETGGFPWTTPVGYYDGNQFPFGADMANGYGLYDMAGNVWEWCNDWYDADYYFYCVRYGIYLNPPGPSSGPYSRVIRGGCWINDNGYYLRCACRNYYSPGGRDRAIGFRLALD
ncbi:MAG: SUMF1/EgtB/PvdO family nonheme iron enzyme [Planctomycetes bacterium]|nr:SUMF1/EgtB/PvdO family nonheme iron enzyme [Planctomycetota bacterium]